MIKYGWRLLNVLRGDAKQSVESIGKSKDFYAVALKSLKQDFGNAFYVSHTKLSELSDKPHYKANDRIARRDFHQKVKCKHLVKIYGLFTNFFTH